MPKRQAYGGPVPVESGSTNITLVGGGRAVDTTIQGASTVQPLDVALLRDAGLPALSDQELQEHEIARLYLAAFGRGADGAGLILQFQTVRTLLTNPGYSLDADLGTIGNNLASSAEFAARYGSLSDTDSSAPFSRMRWGGNRTRPR